MSNTDHLQEYRRKLAAGEVERPKQKNPMGKAAEDPKSMRKAVNAKCYDCIYDPSGAGSWRDQVRACADNKCSLYSIKPK